MRIARLAKTASQRRQRWVIGPGALAATSALLAVLPSAADASVDQDTARQRCIEAIAVGHHDQAVEACRRPLEFQGGSPADQRLAVRAYVTGASAPTTHELGEALSLAYGVRARFPREPWGYAALRDVAERIGDEDMVQQMTEELRRIAPEHEETTRALALSTKRRPSSLVAVGWYTLAMAALATLIHAVARGSKRIGRNMGPATASGLLILCGLLASSGQARAETPPNQIGQWRIDDQDPESTIPTEEKRNRDPLSFAYWLMDLTAKAQQAFDRKDYPAAIRYYHAMALAVPDRAIGFIRLCDSYEAAGDREHAAQACGSALQADGVTAKDYRHYVSLLLAKQGSLNAAEQNSLNAVLTHLRKDPKSAPLADEFQCEIAVRMGDLETIKKCLADRAAAPEKDPKKLSYEWTLAMADNDFVEAHRLLDLAKTSAIPQTQLKQMADATETQATRHHHNVIYAATGVVLLLFAAAGAAALLFASRRRSAAAAVPAPEPAQQAV